MRFPPAKFILLIPTAYLLCVGLAFAKRKHTHAPLPSKVLEAKTIYIDNETGSAQLGDKAHDEFSKWGRFQIVDGPQKADLVFLLSVREYAGHYTTPQTTQTYGRVDDSGNIYATSQTSGGQSVEVIHGRTFLTLIDPATGQNLWSDSLRATGVRPEAWSEVSATESRNKNQVTRGRSGPLLTRHGQSREEMTRSAGSGL